MQLESNYNTKKFPKNSSRIWAKKTASSTGNKITLIYFTRTLPALLQILVVTFAVTSGKVPNVRRILSQTRQTHKTMPTSPLPPQQQPSHYVAQHFRCRAAATAVSSSTITHIVVAATPLWIIAQSADNNSTSCADSVEPITDIWDSVVVSSSRPLPHPPHLLPANQRLKSSS